MTQTQGEDSIGVAYYFIISKPLLTLESNDPYFYANLDHEYMHYSILLK